MNVKGIITAVTVLLTAMGVWADEPPVSDATEECLGCHEVYHPGIVAGWRQSRHARRTPAQAMQVTGPARKLSAPEVPENLQKTVVGCAECHTLRADAHADTFEHNFARVHVVVSSADCAVCHSTEAEQYSHNIMSHARGNLADNPLFQQLQQTILGKTTVAGSRLIFGQPDELTSEEGCFYCHGTHLKLEGFETRETDAGEMKFPKVSGWPNQGVGRINLDGSHGACSACHTRHRFSIATARKPYTCKECHDGPDVPAYKVYSASKHGNIYSSHQSGWNFEAVPWKVGEDFTAPTCAVCHMSLVVSPDETVIAERTHRINDRLPWRLFGLIYAHPHPENPDTTRLRNRAGQPLPTDFDGQPAPEGLIDATERSRRTDAMQAACLSCHSTSWVSGHWRRFEHSIQQTNHATRNATALMQQLWKQGVAEGLARNRNPFDEAVERTWSSIWLFHANSVRFSSAMAGGGDYSVFADGYYQLQQRAVELEERLQPRR